MSQWKTWRRKSPAGSIRNSEFAVPIGGLSLGCDMSRGGVETCDSASIDIFLRMPLEWNRPARAHELVICRLRGRLRLWWCDPAASIKLPTPLASAVVLVLIL